MLKQIKRLSDGHVSENNLFCMFAYLDACSYLNGGKACYMNCEPCFIEYLYDLANQSRIKYKKVMVSLAQMAVSDDNTEYVNTPDGILELAERLLNDAQDGENIWKRPVWYYCKADLKSRLNAMGIRSDGWELQQLFRKYAKELDRG